MLSPAELSRIEADVDAELEEAVAFAEASDWEPVEDLERFAMMDEVPA
jgi:TPP-dependent pyruvate/acetoin dehydrogenase alpha subunit